MDRILIKRQGSYLYARSFAVVVFGLTVVYGGMGAVLAIITESDLEDVLDQIIFPILAFIPVLMMWLGYVGLLVAFKREANSVIELSDEGIRETRGSHEHRFIPWAGVHQIDMSADLFGGMSLKARGAFSDVAISNVDLEITKPMNLARMHRALTGTARMKDLFDKMKASAPHAALRLNRLAKRRMSEYALADGH